MATKPLTSKTKETIQKYIKNGWDIADLINGVNISGLDLSHAKISYFKREYGENLVGINLTNAVIGTLADLENPCNNLIALAGCDLRNSSFSGTKFYGKVQLKCANCRNCNFTWSFIPFVNYSMADLRGCRFCDTVMTIGSREGHGAIFDEAFMDLLKKAYVLKSGKES